MKLSMNVRFLILQIPLYVGGALVCLSAWKSSQGLEAHNEMQKINQLSLKSRHYVAEMGSALKGYMLDPNNKEEAKRKKDADDKNDDAIKQMKALIQDPQLLEQIKNLGELDEKKLNPAEDKVLELVGAKKYKEANTYFMSVYLPLRAEYDEASQKLAEATEKETEAATESFQQSVHDSINRTIIFVGLGILVYSIISMSALSRIARTLRQLRQRLSDVTKVFESTSKSMSTVSQNLAESSTQSSAAIQESVSAMTEMSAMLGQTSRNAEATAELSTQVLQDSQNGLHVMEEMSASTKAIAESSNRLKEIVQVIQNISEKTNVINDVVFKTQLLAVNASIEAARAGHHGKGFAVVANEVASLAALSGKASSEIKELLQSSSVRVADIISGTSDAIHEGELVSAKTSETFSQIAKSISMISDKVEQISVASKEQEAGVAQTSTALSQMNEATTAMNEIAQRNARLGYEVSEQTIQLKDIDAGLTKEVTGKADQNESSKVKRLSQVDQLLSKSKSTVIPMKSTDTNSGRDDSRRSA
jgi:methyl-accepting chemotaxis protein